MADEQVESGGSRLNARVIGLIIVVGIFVWFALVNRNEVKVSFIVTHTKVRLVYALIVAAVLGALADRFATFRRNRR